MASHRELLLEIDATRAHELLAGAEPPALIDIREPHEWATGWIAGAVRIPMSELGEQLEPYRERSVVLYCAHGNRSFRLANALSSRGYPTVVSMAGGIAAWDQAGFPVEVPSGLDAEQRLRYSRHVLIPEIGLEGQQRLLQARVLLLGAGGLGSPAALYLAAAGLGRLGIVDDDVVDSSNLQRQVLHSTAALDEPKVESAQRRLTDLNPDVEVVPYRERLTTENVDRILDEGWDVIVDGADNFPTRYLLNDASVWKGIPVVHGSIFRFEGQATVFSPKGAARGARRQDGRALPVRPSELTGRTADGDPDHVDPGPCYRCLFPQPPPPELAPSCAEGGVLGVLPGVIGSIQASEALKLVLGIGRPLIGRLLLYDALGGTFDEVAVRRDPACPVCGDEPTITEYVDYVGFCDRPG
jgi:molybdopterin/thiamine biosynthesis adenylyltransferase/rhodanese-related sulfurtransferase